MCRNHSALGHKSVYVVSALRHAGFPEVCAVCRKRFMEHRRVGLTAEAGRKHRALWGEAHATRSNRAELERRAHFGSALQEPSCVV